MTEPEDTQNKTNEASEHNLRNDDDPNNVNSPNHENKELDKSDQSTDNNQPVISDQSTISHSGESTTMDKLQNTDEKEITAQQSDTKNTDSDEHNTSGGQDINSETTAHPPDTKETDSDEHNTSGGQDINSKTTAHPPDTKNTDPDEHNTSGGQDINSNNESGTVRGEKKHETEIIQQPNSNGLVIGSNNESETVHGEKKHETEIIQQPNSNGLVIGSHNEHVSELINEKKVHKTEITQQVNNDGRGFGSEVFKTETVQETNTSLYATKHNYGEVDANQLRKRPINQQQELSPSSSNDVNSSNERPNAKKSNLLRIFVFFLILIPAFFYSQHKKSTFLQNLAATTETIIIGINDVEVADISTMNDHTVTLRRAANTIDRNPVFKSYGNQIATGLREFGEKIREAGHLLQKMYSKGSSVHTSFDIEIEAMIQTVQRLNSRYIQDDDARYFKKILDRLITKIRDFRQSVEVARNSILDAEKIERNNEVAIENGFKEAEKYSNNEKYSVDIYKARNELVPINNILFHLHTTVGRLDKLITMLRGYENNLRDVSEELNEERGVKVSKAELKGLQSAIDNAKASHNKFSQISD